MSGVSLTKGGRERDRNEKLKQQANIIVVACYLRRRRDFEKIINALPHWEEVNPARLAI